MNWLEEQVHLAIGRASMCWHEFPQGKYNDVYACQIAQELIQAITSWLSEEEKQQVHEKQQQLRMRPEHVLRFEHPDSN